MAKCDHVEQLNHILSVFHRELRRYPLVYDKDQWNFKIPENPDPDLFLMGKKSKDENESIRTLFAEHPVFAKTILNELGFGLEVKASTNPHHKIKNGVFLRIKGDQKIRAGSLVGFVPGIYQQKSMGNFFPEQPSLARINGYEFEMGSSLIYPNDDNCSVSWFDTAIKKDLWGH